MALGMGFGIGEAIFLAWNIAVSGVYEQYAWYMFTGFLGERIVVVFAHGFMTGMFVWLAARRRPIRGFLAAAATHAMLNAGAMFYQLGLAPGWAAGVSLAAVLFACVIFFERIRPRLPRMGPDREIVYFSAGE
jgi:uncharacterized membrane protein YhfC